MVAFVLLGVGIFSAFGAQAAGTGFFQYRLLEGIPGFFNKNQELSDLPALISAVYKFGIWTVGISAMFMIIIGGFTYMTSAGNKSSAGNAKSIISDSILGLVVALAAYLFLYVINPDLTKIKLNLISVEVDGVPIGAGGTGGKCVPVTKAGKSGTVEQLTASFGSNATKASSIVKIESGGDPNLLSGVDVCSDGKSFSVGLFQINMIDSAPSICNAQGEIFTTGTSKGTCLEKNAWGTCMKWSCAVKDKAKYDECVARLKDPATNISLAKQISNSGNSWSRWGANKTCRF